MKNLALSRKQFGSVVFCVVVIAAPLFFIAGLVANPSTTFTIDSGPYPSGEAKYTIYNVSGIYYAKDQNGYNEFSGTNPTVVIQNALDGLTAGRTWQEKVILSGTIEVDGTLFLPSYVILDVQGELLAANSLDAPLMVNSVGEGVAAYVDPVSRNTHITIEGAGIIDGNKYNMGTGHDNHNTIHMTGVNNLKIRGLTILRGWTAAIHVEYSTNVLVANNIIDDSADDAIAINKETYHAVVVGNVITNSGMGGKNYGGPCGIEVQDGARYVTVSSNSINYTLGAGIQVSAHTSEDGCRFINIVGNTIYNVGTHGVEVEAESTSYAQHVDVISNEINNCTYHGVTVTLANYTAVQGNHVNGATEKGIRVITAVNVVVANNYVENGNNYGIILEPDVNYTRVSGNTCIDNGAGGGNPVGIGVNGDYNFLFKNYCYDSRSGAARTQQYGIVFYSGADHNNCTRNIVYNNSVDGILDAGTDNTVSGNIEY